MKNYFMAPRSGEKSYDNFESSIKNGVPLERIAAHLTPEEISILSSQDVIYAWGNREGTKSAWNTMKEGDSVIFSSKGVLVMVGEVYLKKHSPQLALALWPPDEKNNPWSYTFFLKNIRYISIPIKVFNITVGYEPNYVVQGFTILKEDKVKKILEKYGSVEEMLGLFEDNNSVEIPKTGERVYMNLSEDLNPLILRDEHLIPKAEGEKIYTKTAKKKIDYQLKNLNNSVTGNKGEEIVLKIERENLRNAGLNELADKVDRVSSKDDTVGYDILSYDKDGKEKYIEVKASAQTGSTVRFFVSLNEYNIGMKKDNYYIYYVQDINSEQPKVSIIKNPMDNSKFLIQPEGYIFEAQRVND
jgi:hypothetical protein